MLLTLQITFILITHFERKTTTNDQYMENASNFQAKNSRTILVIRL